MSVSSGIRRVNDIASIVRSVGLDAAPLRIFARCIGWILASAATVVCLAHASNTRRRLARKFLARLGGAVLVSCMFLAYRLYYPLSNGIPPSHQENGHESAAHSRRTEQGA